jgi:hypothetical protein
MRTINWRTTTLAALAFLVGTIAAGSGSLRAAWEPIARFVSPQEAPKPASANVLSEHEIAALAKMPLQSQAELLLERAINHYTGASDQIAVRVDTWRGHITLGGRLQNLLITAINSDDLTVRVAGIEVDIAARNLTKDSSTVDRLEPVARSGEQGPRANALWDLALVGNRGVDPDRVADILLSSVDDRNVNIRYCGRGSRLSRDGRSDCAVTRRLPRRPVSDDPRARRLRPLTVRHVQRGAAPHGRAALARLCAGWRARRRDAHVGLSGAARHYGSDPASRRNPVETMVRVGQNDDPRNASAGIGTPGAERR